MKPETIIKDIIWAYTKTGNIPQVQKMYAPVIAAYAMAKSKTMNFDKIKMANQSYNFDVVEKFIYGNLKKVRIKNGFTQRYVADRCGITASMICMIEKGKRINLSMKTAKSIRIFILNNNKK